MLTLQVSRSPETTSATDASVRYPWLRSLLLFMLLVISLVLYVFLIGAAPRRDDLVMPFVQMWMVCFLPYFAACAVIFLCKRPRNGRWRWIELALIVGGALIFRLMLLPLPPGLSHDSWRYVWDARVTLRGYSPYVYPPDDKALKFLQDNLIYGNSRFRNVPTIYPPGAQAIYILSYLIAPSNLFALKGIFILFDMVTCIALAVFLHRRGLDPARSLIYAWCPLPIVEFAIQGHVDVLPLTFTVLALLTAESTWRGSRVVTGFFIAMATLTKIYPIVFLLVVWRKWDWALLATCFTTIIVGYIPFLILGHGQVFGFFSTYASEQGGNAGIIQAQLYWQGLKLHVPLATIVLVEHIVDLAVVGIASLIVFVLRQREKISMEAGTILLFGAILSVSSHVFPWYTTALIPWIAVLLGPLWIRKGGLQGKTIAILSAWYFISISPYGYAFSLTLNWEMYYLVVYDVVVAALLLAALVGVFHWLKERDGAPFFWLVRR